MLCQPDDFTYLANVKHHAGKLVARGGTVIQGSAPASAKVTWLFAAYGTNASTALAVWMAMVDTVLYYKIGAGAWTSFKTGLTAGTYPVAVQYQGHVYWCDGVNTPLDITIANPPTAATWATLPSGINPAWVVLHKNRLIYGNDLTTPQYVYFTDFGTPTSTQTTSFYFQPDDQNGNFAKIAVNCQNRVALFCQDYLVAKSGTGPNTDNFFQFPRGAACTAWRSVVDMGEFGVLYLSSNGVMSFDGNTPPEPVDQNGGVNVADIDLTTEALTWAMRVGDEYRLYFKSKGDVRTSAATAAQIMSSSSAITRVNAVYNTPNILTRAAFVVPSATATTAYYYSFDCRKKLWTGPHNGQHLCGCWTKYMYGDTQDPLVGSSLADGVICLADQQSAFTDNGAPYDCIIRTGAIGDPYRKTKITRVRTKWDIGSQPASKVRCAVWEEGRSIEPPQAAYDLSLYRKKDGKDLEDLVQHNFTPSYRSVAGREPQIEYRFTPSEGIGFRGHSVEFTSEE